MVLVQLSQNISALTRLGGLNRISNILFYSYLRLFYSTGLSLSSIYNQTALLFHVSNKFLKFLKRIQHTKELMEEQWTELFTITGFEALVNAHDEVNSRD